MTGQEHSVPLEATPLLGDLHPLLAQVGVSEKSAASSLTLAAMRFRQAKTLPALRGFLDSYRQELLLPLELPAILKSYHHTVRHEPRELILLDQQMAQEPKVRDFAAASYRVGQRQLNRLRPLRDHRVVQRYLAAIEREEAHGWHTLVYGVALGVFSLPLRQGLLGYASHTLDGFIQQAAGPLALTVAQCAELQVRANEKVAEEISLLLQPPEKQTLRIC